MKLRVILSPYLNRLRWESFLRALFAALAGGLIASVVTMIGMWIVDMPYDFTWVLIIAGATAGVILLGCYLFVFHISYRTAIRRIDASGLQARLTTMRELRKDNSFMAQRQREDTLKHLKGLNIRAVTLNLPHITATVTAAAVLVAGLLFLVPLRSHAMAGDPYVEDPYEEKYDLLEQLKEDIYLKAEGNPELEDFLKNLDELLNRNPDGSGVTDFETIEKLEDLKDQIEQKIEENRVSKVIGQAYVDFTGFSEAEQEARPEWVSQVTKLFKNFGNALISREEARVNAALNGIRKAIDTCPQEERDIFTDFIVYYTNQVLAGTPAGAQESELALAIYHLSDNLNLAASTPLLSEPYDAAIKTGQREINRALELEIEREEQMKEILEKIQEAIDKLLPEGTPEDKKDPFDEPEKDPTGELKPEENPNNPQNPDNSEKPEKPDQPEDPENPNENQNQNQQNPSGSPGQQPPDENNPDQGDIEDEPEGGEVGTFVDPYTGELVPATKENLQPFIEDCENRLANDKGLDEDQKEQIKKFYEYLQGILGEIEDDSDKPEDNKDENQS